MQRSRIFLADLSKGTFAVTDGYYNRALAETNNEKHLYKCTFNANFARGRSSLIVI